MGHLDEKAVELVAVAALVLTVAAGTSVVCRFVRIPVVVGQIFAGVLLGPSVFGRFLPTVADAVMPTEVRPYVSAIAQVGLVFFLFSVGADLDLGLLEEHRSVVPGVFVGAFVLPLAVGAGSGLLLWVMAPVFGGPHATQATFVLFMAVALSITAVPVLAAIIEERGLSGSTAGTVSLASAGVMDIAAWSILAVAIGLATGRSVLGDRWWLLLAYVAALLLARRLLLWWFSRGNQLSTQYLPGLAAFVLASAWATGRLGLHLIFGALVAGVLMPRASDGHVRPDLTAPVKQVGNVLLPLFFVTSGWSVNVGALNQTDLVVLATLCAAAVITKVAGGVLTARWSGLSWHDSGITGILLNTRGLTELIALNVGLQAGIIGIRLYTILVVIALVTTALTGPLLQLMLRNATPTARSGHTSTAADGKSGA